MGADREAVSLEIQLNPPASPAALDGALEWVRYLGIPEPECSACVPAWPAELMGMAGLG